MNRTVAVMAAASLVGFLLLSACTDVTRYRVLSFFLDGVPPPGTPPPSKRRATYAAPAPATSVEAPSPQAARVNMFPHPPYRDNRCGGCHDLESGGLVQPLDRGLCQSCHREIPGDLLYVHGPVAVSGCVQCHHYHAAPFPKLLLRGPTATCLQCHDRNDLSPTPHDLANPDSGNCMECHDPHGGGNRFFLKRSSE